MKAYLLSRENGIIQIGRRVYCLASGNMFDVDRRGLRDKPKCDVYENSWAEARRAYRKLTQGV